VICAVKGPAESYAELEVLPGARERLRKWRACGHVVIIHTARHMATCEGNVGKVMKKVGQVTLEWLERNGIEYDEIYFGKPNGHVYIDDRGLRFDSWDELTVEALDAVAKAR
jgi:capsule biosynthesis phosphatase